MKSVSSEQILSVLLFGFNCLDLMVTDVMFSKHIVDVQEKIIYQPYFFLITRTILIFELLLTLIISLKKAILICLGKQEKKKKKKKKNTKKGMSRIQSGITLLDLLFSAYHLPYFYQVNVRSQ